MPTMRRDARNVEAVTLVNAHSYHGSHFEKLRYFDSDRDRKLADVAIPRAFGLEIETETKLLSDLNAYAEVLKKICCAELPNDFMRIETDASLGHGGHGCSGSAYAGYKWGLEMPTQIMTKQRIRNEYRNFKLMFNTWFPRFQISCYEGHSCGMHVNISSGFFGKTEAKQYEAMRKLIYFINKNYKLACKLFYRREEFTDFCGQMSFCTSKDYCKRLNLNRMENNHGICINGAHIREPIQSSRIELRLVGGQKDYYSFRNTMECVFFICERVKDISWNDIDKLDVFFKGCNQYVCKRLDDCVDAGLVTAGWLADVRQNSIYEDLEIRG